MKTSISRLWIAFVAAAGSIWLGAANAPAQTPDIVWEVPTPSGLGNSIASVAWSPGKPAMQRVAMGSTDRWVRTRQAASGALVYSVLQPHRAGTADQTIYSMTGVWLAVHNSSGGTGFRVHRASDGLFAGTLTATLDGRGIVVFAPDAQLSSFAGGDGTLSQWRVQDFRVINVTGTGYDRVFTVFNFSPDGTLQSTASKGTITIRRRADGLVVRSLSGGAAQGSSVVSFTPDSTGLAAWAPSPNETTLWRISDGAVLRRFPSAAAEEGTISIRFTPDGSRMVTTGYLPYIDAGGLWQQKGFVRFWRVADGVLRAQYYDHTGIGVTSPVALSLDGTRFAYGTYEGTIVAAKMPLP
jgi:WD40 repeat protein